jgi:hypothetical protein
MTASESQQVLADLIEADSGETAPASQTLGQSDDPSGEVVIRSQEMSQSRPDGAAVFAAGLRREFRQTAAARKPRIRAGAQTRR